MSKFKPNEEQIELCEVIEDMAESARTLRHGYCDTTESIMQSYLALQTAIYCVLSKTADEIRIKELSR